MSSNKYCALVTLALRVCHAFRRISDDATGVIAEMVRVAILVSTARYLYDKKRMSLPKKDAEYRRALAVAAKLTTTVESLLKG